MGGSTSNVSVSAASFLWLGLACFALLWFSLSAFDHNCGKTRHVCLWFIKEETKRIMIYISLSRFLVAKKKATNKQSTINTDERPKKFVNDIRRKHTFRKRKTSGARLLPRKQTPLGTGPTTRLGVARQTSPGGSDRRVPRTVKTVFQKCESSSILYSIRSILDTRTHTKQEQEGWFPSFIPFHSFVRHCRCLGGWNDPKSPFFPMIRHHEPKKNGAAATAREKDVWDERRLGLAWLGG